MTKIYRVSGIGDDSINELGFTLIDHDPEHMTEGHMDLLIARDKMVKNRNIVRQKHGVGSPKSEKYNNTIDVLDDAIHGLNHSDDPEHYMAMIEEDILNGVYSNHDEVTGIGCPNTIYGIRAKKAQHRRARRAERMAKEAVSGIGAKKKAAQPKTKTGKFLKKAVQKTAPALKNVAKGAKNVAKKAGHVIKKVAQLSPAALAAKGILEITLPKAAPFFLYLFINDPKIIAKLPAKAARKRNKQVAIKNFIVNVLGMKDAHFMGIVRNGIVKQMGASPETILSKSIHAVNGIGDIGIIADIAMAAKAVPVVIEIIQKIASVFKKGKPAGTDATKDDAPSADDFAEMDTATVKQLSTAIKLQNDEPEPLQTKTTSLPEMNTDREIIPSNPGSQGGPEGKGDQGDGDKKYKDPSGNKDSDAQDLKSNTDGKSEVDKSKDTDAEGEIQKDAGDDHATGGRKEWNSLGGGNNNNQ